MIHTDSHSISAYTTSAFTAVWGLMTVEIIVALIGVLFGLVTMVVNIHYKKKEDARAQERHNLHMSSFSGPDDSSL